MTSIVWYMVINIITSERALIWKYDKKSVRKHVAWFPKYLDPNQESKFLTLMVFKKYLSGYFEIQFWAENQKISLSIHAKSSRNWTYNCIRVELIRFKVNLCWICRADAGIKKFNFFLNHMFYDVLSYIYKSSYL